MPSEHRLHPWSVAFLIGAHLRQFAVPALLAVFVGSRARGGQWELFALPILALPILTPYIVFVIVRYFTFHYAFGDGELIIRSGLIFKNERHVPYARIQNLDAVQTALHRLLGVVDVRVDTGGSAGTDATLSVVSWAAYEQMRARVLSERAIARPEAAEAPHGSDQLILALPPRELALQGFIENRAAVLIAALVGLVWESGMLEAAVSRLGIDGVSRGVLRQIAVSMFRDRTLPFDMLLAVLGAFAAFVVGLRLLSMVWAMVRLHGFRLTRVGPDLRTEYGLLTRVSTTVPLHRIQTLTIRRGWIHRWSGRAAVQAETAGAGGETPGGGSHGRESLAPIIREAHVPAFLRTVLPDLDLTHIDWQPAAPGAFRRVARVRLAVAAVGGVAAAAGLTPGWAGVVVAVLGGWAWFSARVYTRSLGWAFIDGGVLCRAGWMWRRMTIARFSKVQAVSLTQSPFDRRHRMASVSADTAGAGSNQISIPYLSEETASAVYSRLAQGAATTAFRW